MIVNVRRCSCAHLNDNEWHYNNHGTFFTRARYTIFSLTLSRYCASVWILQTIMLYDSQYTYSKQRIFIITANWNDSELSNNIIVALRAYILLKWLSPEQLRIYMKQMLADVGFLRLHPIDSYISMLSSLSYSMCHLSQLSHFNLYATYTHNRTPFVPLRNDYDAHKFMTWNGDKKKLRKNATDSVQINYAFYSCLVEWHKFDSFFKARASFENANLCI